MPSKQFGKGACLVGCLLMAHAAFAMIQFRHYVRATGDELLSTPIDIVIEALVALALCTLGASWWAGSFKKILAAPTLWTRRYDGSSSVDDFQIFAHRGKAFAQWKLHDDFSAIPEAKAKSRGKTIEEKVE